MVRCKSRIPADPQLESEPSTVLGTENNYGIPATLMCIISDWNWPELGWWRWLVIAKPGSSTKPSSYPQPSPAPSSRQPRPRKSVIISQQQRHRPICHPPPGAGLARSGAVLTSFVDCSLQTLKHNLSLSLTLKLVKFCYIYAYRKGGWYLQPEESRGPPVDLIKV